MDTVNYLGQAKQLLQTPFKQAYSETPWRKQIKLAIQVLMVVLIGAVVAGVIMSFSSQATTDGRKIQDLQEQIKIKQYKIIDKQLQVAILNSNQELRKQIEGMKFEPVTADQLVYLPVAASLPSADDKKAAPVITDKKPAAGPLMLPEYSQSWVDWLYQRMQELRPLYDVSEGR